MGDTCDIILWFRESDVVEACNQLDADASMFKKTIDGTWMYREEEINYGGETELDELTAAKIPFVGSHGAGGSYGPYLLCGDGVERKSWEVDGNGDCAIGIPWHNATDVSLDLMARVGECVRFQQFYDKCKQIVEVTESAVPQ